MDIESGLPLLRGLRRQEQAEDEKASAEVFRREQRRVTDGRFFFDHERRYRASRRGSGLTDVLSKHRVLPHRDFTAGLDDAPVLRP
ncbi:hypothetical protein [Streptomyces sp. SID3343]|uniref:hypothetical protein n=1 Tax=Streptomyces sp. SID3343 TaxID=2690260 RepID=UPI001368A622|nr:hypothetical protein [Streptomyces sp. SID3343]MYW01315.1 hypothetical protein [Streptomyces sp. SID3343]